MNNGDVFETNQALVSVFSVPPLIPSSLSLVGHTTVETGRFSPIAGHASSWFCQRPCPAATSSTITARYNFTKYFPSVPAQWVVRLNTELGSRAGTGRYDRSPAV